MGASMEYNKTDGRTYIFSNKELKVDATKIYNMDSVQYKYDFSDAEQWKNANAKNEVVDKKQETISVKERKEIEFANATLEKQIHHLSRTNKEFVTILKQISGKDPQASANLEAFLKKPAGKSLAPVLGGSDAEKLTALLTYTYGDQRFKKLKEVDQKIYKQTRTDAVLKAE